VKAAALKASSKGLANTGDDDVRAAGSCRICNSHNAWIGAMFVQAVLSPFGDSTRGVSNQRLSVTGRQSCAKAPTKV
jgi:hypothetical protein